MSDITTVQPSRDTIRNAVRSFYDAQSLRIEMGNRIAAQIRAAFIGPKPRGFEEDIAQTPEFKAWDKARLAFNKQVDDWDEGNGLSGLTLLAAFLRAHEPAFPGVITADWAARLIAHHDRQRIVEAELGKDVGLLCKGWDIWPWLDSVKGCGPAMSGVLLAEIGDPGRFRTVSALWAFAGLHVIDGRAARRTKGERANWNNFLKTKLLGVLAPCFLKANSPYREHYDNMKHRLESLPCSMTPEQHRKGATAETLLPNGCTKGHMHNKAVRYMAKMFLLDLYVTWNGLRGNAIRNSYQQDYLGHDHAVWE